MGTYNLMDEAWIPIRRRSGARGWIAPWQITETEDPPLQLDSPRSDFDGALVQFLIGLVQTTLTPPGQEVWRERFRRPPSPEELKQAFARYRDAFWLDGDGARFLQDLEMTADPKKSTPVESLLIDAPGENTVKLNKDFFIHRGRVEAMSLPIAAMALLTLQTNAPAGGAGHRTSLRGGGPLTTVLLGRTLWESVWLNVLCRMDADKIPGSRGTDAPESIFPWLAPTRTSQKGGQTTAPHDMNPFQHFWGMPRRIRLAIEGEGTCSLLGRPAERVVRGYTTLAGGVNYEGDFRHPLTPHTRPNAKQPWLTRKGQPTGLAYRDWPALTVELTETNEPARCVVAAYQEGRLARLKEGHGRLWVFGYDMDNMKARCWYDGTTPIFPIEDGDQRQLFAALVRRCVEASEYARDLLLKKVKQALLRRPQDARGDFSYINQQFWAATERRFYDTLDRLQQAIVAGQDHGPVYEAWLKLLSEACARIFQDNAQLQGEFAATDVKRVATAWNELRRTTSPGSPRFRKTLDLQPLSR